MSRVPLPSQAKFERLKAESAFIPDLLEMVREGRVRIPDFQRTWKWKKKQVSELFDSIWRGFPIGSLLLWRRAGPDQTIRLGPLEISARSRSDALYVVDGQQRLTALAGVLLRTKGLSVSEEFELYFDIHEKEFRYLNQDEQPDDKRLLPLTEIITYKKLNPWVRRAGLREEEEVLVDDVSAAVQKYRIPYYIVETEDERGLRVVFDRINNAGVRLRWDEAMDALLGAGGKRRPSGIKDLSDIVEEMRFGELPGNEIGKAVQAVHGWDLTRDFHEFIDEDLLKSDGRAFRDTVEPLRKGIAFLQQDALIPHRRLLPYAFPLYVLARFFALHPSPSPRSKLLMSRWLWRGFATRAFAREYAPTVRASFRALGTASEAEAQAVALLARVGDRSTQSLEIDTRFDRRSAESRIHLAAMAWKRPRDLRSGQYIDIPLLFSEFDAQAAPRVFPRKREGVDEQLFSSTANRLLHSPLTNSSVYSFMRENTISREALSSHLFPPDLVTPVTVPDLIDALHQRRKNLLVAIEEFLDVRCAWRMSDRRSINEILREVEE